MMSNWTTTTTTVVVKVAAAVVVVVLVLPAAAIALFSPQWQIVNKKWRKSGIIFGNFDLLLR